MKQLPNITSLTLGLFARHNAMLDVRDLPLNCETLNILNCRSISLKTEDVPNQIKTVRCLSFIHPRQSVQFLPLWPTIEQLSFSFENTYAEHHVLRALKEGLLTELKSMEVHTSQAGMADQAAWSTLHDLETQCALRGVKFRIADRPLVSACLVSK